LIELIISGLESLNIFLKKDIISSKYKGIKLKISTGNIDTNTSNNVCCSKEL